FVFGSISWNSNGIAIGIGPSGAGYSTSNTQQLADLGGQGSAPGSTYVPAHMENGELVPGQMISPQEQARDETAHPEQQNLDPSNQEHEIDHPPQEPDQTQQPEQL